MTYTPDPARVRELAERLIVHRATGPDTAADALGYDGTIPENESLSDGDWGVLMAAVDEAAKNAKITIRFPE